MSVFKYRTRKIRPEGRYEIQVFAGPEEGRLQNAGSFLLEREEFENWLVELGAQTYFNSTMNWSKIVWENLDDGQ